MLALRSKVLHKVLRGTINGIISVLHGSSSADGSNMEVSAVCGAVSSYVELQSTDHDAYGRVQELIRNLITTRIVFEVNIRHNGCALLYAEVRGQVFQGEDTVPGVTAISYIRKGFSHLSYWRRPRSMKYSRPIYKSLALLKCIYVTLSNTKASHQVITQDFVLHQTFNNHVLYT